MARTSKNSRKYLKKKIKYAVLLEAMQKKKKNYAVAIRFELACRHSRANFELLFNLQQYFHSSTVQVSIGKYTIVRAILPGLQ